MLYAMPDISRSPSLESAPADEDKPQASLLPAMLELAPGKTDRPPPWALGLVVSAIGHVLVVGALFLGITRKDPVEPAERPAMAIQLMPLPSAPPTPSHDTPEPEQPETKQQDTPRPDPLPIPKVPVIPHAADAVTLPARPQPVQPPREPPPPPPPALAQSRQAPAAAPVQGQPVSGAANNMQNWESRVIARLEQKKRYPGAAMRQRQQDVIYVHLVVDRSGRVLESRIVKSQHFRALDDAVMDLIKRATPLPPLPDAIAGSSYGFTVPVDYFINNAN